MTTQIADDLIFGSEDFAIEEIENSGDWFSPRIFGI